MAASTSAQAAETRPRTPAAEDIAFVGCLASEDLPLQRGGMSTTHAPTLLLGQSGLQNMTL